MIKRDILELVNLPLEGHFQALYGPLGGSRTRKENASLKSMKLYVSMFSDKSPCMPLCFSAIDHTAIGGRAFSSFLAFAVAVFSLFKLYSNDFFFSFFFLLLFFFQFFSFSSTFSSFLGSIFSPNGLCNCLRLSFQPG